mgnify:CR=1 FL=1
MLVLTVIIVLISVLLVLIVLLQKSKGGGLAAGFQSSNQIMGAPKTANFLEKATWTLMGVIAIFCICCTLILKHSGSAATSNAIELQEQSAPLLPETVAEESAETAPEAPADAE